VAPPPEPPKPVETTPVAPPPEPPKPAETAAATPPPEPPKPVAEVKKGEAVYYDANSRGSCSLTFGKDASVLSAPNDVYNAIQSCGQCLEITGPKGTEVVMVADRCNDCAANKLVINKPAFEKIAGKAVGTAEVSWKAVPCAVTGEIEYRFKKTSSEYWTAIQVRNHRVPVKAVAWKKGNEWIEMTRSDDNYFVAAKGVGAKSVTLRVTSADGQSIEQTFAKWKDGETYKGSSQFK
jgi:expansin (peptidoglycan-binding protein)